MYYSSPGTRSANVWCVQLSPLVDRYGNPIGDDLFSIIGYTHGDMICYFFIKWISLDTAEERQA